MSSSSASKDFSLVTIIVSVSVLSAFILGATYLQKNPSLLPSKPLISLLEIEKLPIAGDLHKRELYLGKSEEEVRELLGEPTGVINISDKTILMYNGVLLEFGTEGGLTTPPEGLLEEIKIAKKKAAARTAPSR